MRKYRSPGGGNHSSAPTEGRPRREVGARRGVRTGFTFLEVMVAVFILAVALLSLFAVISTAGRGTMDAYFEQMALSLAKEPIEVFQAFGYHWLALGKPLPEFPPGWSEVPGTPDSPILHPAEANQFQRHISLEPLERDGIRGFLVQVTVRPRGMGRVAAWLSRNDLVLSAFIMEKPL